MLPNINVTPTATDSDNPERTEELVTNFVVGISIIHRKLDLVLSQDSWINPIDLDCLVCPIVRLYVLDPNLSRNLI